MPENRLQGYSFAVSCASLVIAIVALILALSLAPIPANPSRVPTIGESGSTMFVNDIETGREFADFIEDYPGRKVAIYVDIDIDQFKLIEDPAEKDQTLYIPSDDCPPSARPLDLDADQCSIFVIRVRNLAEDRIGFVNEHGVVRLAGYFANGGYSGMGMGYFVYSLTPLTDIESMG